MVGIVTSQYKTQVAHNTNIDLVWGWDKLSTSQVKPTMLYLKNSGLRVDHWVLQKKRTGSNFPWQSSKHTPTPLKIETPRFTVYCPPAKVVLMINSLLLTINCYTHTHTTSLLGLLLTIVYAQCAHMQSKTPLIQHHAMTAVAIKSKM